MQDDPTMKNYRAQKTAEAVPSEVVGLQEQTNYYAFKFQVYT
uniref:Uncharacterized protein n=1 Tax=Manihot esculenta TaxID=3983 RepID=A0A2C9UDN8_MANES